MGFGWPGLPRSFKQLNDKIGGEIADCILVGARSSGTLALPGAFSTESPPRPHVWEVLARGDTGFFVEKTVIGTPRRYHVLYQVENSRDSGITAVLRWTDLLEVDAPDAHLDEGESPGDEQDPADVVTGSDDHADGDEDEGAATGDADAEPVLTSL